MSPDYYTKGRKYEPKDVIRDWDLNFNLGNVVKYVSRAGRKDPNTLIEDLLKARDYIQFELDALMNEENEDIRSRDLTYEDLVKKALLSPVGELRLKHEKCCDKEGTDG